MTAAQQRVYDILKERTERNGYPPSVREIAAELDCNVNNVQGLLYRLMREGHVVHGEFNSSRTWRVVEKKGIPLLDMKQLPKLLKA